ncbi:hypothetical protein predicted by Glimmer/Critica [Acetobacter ghanensis]|nr:hypothetical protein [Acetobacter ghanensis]CEF53889.1 hypothetical protein predicted by Glimmer/Critica [Acetobacter ghanensis]
MKIKNPWGDDSLSIDVPDDPESLASLASHMENIFLPERFTAIYHKKEKDLEFIFTAFTLSNAAKEIASRHFSFHLNGKTHICEYAASSDNLIAIAKNIKMVSQSVTDYRNLQSFMLYAFKTDNTESLTSTLSAATIGEPISFWVRNVDWDDNKILAIVRNLNFMMSYYDYLSPNIIIHTPATEQTTNQPRPRYKIGSFPKEINATELDENILAFWMASKSGDPIQRFLFSYRIIEYISFTYLDAEARNTIKRAIKSPHALHNIEKTTDLVVGAIQGCKLSDVQKLEAVIKELVDPENLWNEISCDTDAFSKSIDFDGGVKLNSLINNGWKFEDFQVNGIDKFCKQIREIRNALSHGREQKTSMVIAPTTKNFSLLRPWAALIAAAAEDIIINRTSIH